MPECACFRGILVGPESVEACPDCARYPDDTSACKALLQGVPWIKLLDGMLDVEGSCLPVYPPDDDTEALYNLVVGLRECRYCAGTGEAYDPSTGEGPECPACKRGP